MDGARRSHSSANARVGPVSAAAAFPRSFDFPRADDPTQTGRMFHVPTLSSDPSAFHEQLRAQLAALLGDERDLVANLANAAALIWHTTPDLNWAGFYLRRSESELVLGPFQGKPACVRITVGRGVCGTAVEREASVLVDDVHAFPGHIACDGASRSELVVPIRHDGRVVGVLDLDSPSLARFSEADREGFEAFVRTLVACTDLVSVS
jgi:L-methionine (R)-S-oxide reductase